ncbi:MAG: glycosyltransferase family 2 protein [Bacteroidota bacterium]
MKETIDIVLPCYNPGDTWHSELTSFNGHIKDRYNINYILVNDGSGPNKIQDRVEQLRREGISLKYIVYAKNRGKGYALRQGVLVSESKFVIYTDVDFPFTNESVGGLVEKLVNSGCDVVAGYRDENYYLKSMSAYRKFLSMAFRTFIKRILRLPVTDTQCGLKGFNAKGRKKFLETTINRYLFDFEFIYASVKDPAIHLETIPVKLKEGIVFSKMKLKILLQEIFNLVYVLVFKKT